MSELRLYEMTAVYRQLLETLSEGDFDAQTIADTVEASGIVDEIAAKATGLELVARTMEMHTPAIDAEIARLSALKKQREKAAAGLRAYLLRNMLDAGIEKIDSPLFKIKLAKNPAALEVFEAATVPEKFWVQPPTPPKAIDNAALKAALKAGEDVPGAKLTQGVRLVVA